MAREKLEEQVEALTKEELGEEIDLLIQTVKQEVGLDLGDGGSDDVMDGMEYGRFDLDEDMEDARSSDLWTVSSYLLLRSPGF